MPKNIIAKLATSLPWHIENNDVISDLHGDSDHKRICPVKRAGSSRDSLFKKFNFC